MAADPSKANKALIADILRAYGQGDWRPLLSAIHEDVSWESHAGAPPYRFGGPRRGHDGVMEALALIAAEYAIQRYDVKQLVAEDDTVWALSEGAYVHRGSNKLITMPIATRWVLREGKVVDYHGFFDSAQVLAKQAAE